MPAPKENKIEIISQLDLLKFNKGLEEFREKIFRAQKDIRKLSQFFRDHDRKESILISELEGDIGRRIFDLLNNLWLIQKSLKKEIKEE